MNTGSTTDYGHLMPLFRRLADPGLTDVERARTRDHLIKAHLPLAEHIARRFRDRGQPEEDLRQVAALGLVMAVDRFDIGRGVDFLLFAVPSITGELRRYFRDATWALHVPRRLQELSRAIRSASDQLAHRLGRAPRVSEVAAHLNIPVRDVHEGLQASYAHDIEPIENPYGQMPAADLIGDLDGRLEWAAERVALYPALARLPERDALVLKLRFFGEMTQSQIADRIGVSQMQVSRILSASLGALRDMLDVHDPDEDTRPAGSAGRAGRRASPVRVGW